MNTFKTKHLLLILSVLLVPGCASIDNFFTKKPVLSMILMKNFISAHIGKQSDSEAMAVRIIASADKYQTKVSSIAVLDTAGAIALLKKVVKYDKMSIPNKSAFDDALTLAQIEDVEKSIDVPVSIKMLLDAARQAAQLYL